MAWKTRGLRRYFYRSRRVGKRVKTDYVGGGYTGAVVAQLDFRLQAEREAAREQATVERQRLKSVDAALREFAAAVEGAVCASLLSAGFHSGNPGHWRRRSTAKVLGKPAPNPAEVWNRMQRNLPRNAHWRPRTAQPLRSGPDDQSEVWISLEQMGQKAEQTLIEFIDPTDEQSRVLHRQQLAAVRAGVADEQARPLDRLLAQLVAVTWLYASYAATMLIRRGRAADIPQFKVMKWCWDRARVLFKKSRKHLEKVRQLIPAEPADPTATEQPML